MSLLSKLTRRIASLGRKRSFALNQLDLKLEPYLDFDGGFFIEAGANDGVSQSNTLYFEKYRKWRGLLIEPIPELAERCRRNRPKSTVENVALTPADFQGEQVSMRYCNLMSQVKGAMKSDAEELEHIGRGCRVQDIESRELLVTAMPLSRILDSLGVDRIDLLSLDVEGYELQALQGLDLARHAPRFMLIEARYRQEIEDYLYPRYEVAAELSHHDILFRRTAA